MHISRLKHLTKIGFIFFLTIILRGCQNSDNNAPENTPITNSQNSDTIVNTNPDSIGIIKPNDQTKQNTSSKLELSITPFGDLELQDYEIKYDKNFDAFLSAKVGNNNTKSIIAFEIEINSGNGCDVQTIRKKGILLPGRTISVKQKIKKEKSCIGGTRIYIGDYVFSDGSKRDPGTLYLSRRGSSSN